MTTLTIGQGKQFSTVAAAVRASRDGDVLAIDAGTYTNDFATISTKITLQGVGGTAHMVATQAPPNGKGILVTNTDITIDRMEFSGAAVVDNNGAGIRYQGGNLTITNSSFHDNQNGLLSNPVPGGSITIRNSEFSRNGAGDGRTHNLYVTDIGTLTISDSTFRDASVGHQIKSRAQVTTITGSTISDGDGNGSYSIDLPNGGRAVISNNFIEQGRNSGNPVIIAFGEEGNVHGGSSLEVRGNTFVNEMSSPSTKLLWNATGATAILAGNSVSGLRESEYSTGPVNVSGMTRLDAAPVANPPAAPAPVAAAPVVLPAVEAAPVVAPVIEEVQPATPPVETVAQPAVTPPVVETAQPAPAPVQAAAAPPVVEAPIVTPPVVEPVQQAPAPIVVAVPPPVVEAPAVAPPAVEEVQQTPVPVENVAQPPAVEAAPVAVVPAPPAAEAATPASGIVVGDGGSAAGEVIQAPPAEPQLPDTFVFGGEAATDAQPIRMEYSWGDFARLFLRQGMEASAVSHDGDANGFTESLTANGAGELSHVDTVSGHFLFG